MLFLLQGQTYNMFTSDHAYFFLVDYIKMQHFFGIYQTKSTWEPKRVRFEKGTYHQLFRYLKCENQPATAQPTTMHNLICFC